MTILLALHTITNSLVDILYKLYMPYPFAKICCLVFDKVIENCRSSYIFFVIVICLLVVVILQF